MNSIPIFAVEDNLPRHVGHLVLGDVRIYPEKAYGIRIRYVDAGGTKADIYLYDLNISTLPQDIRSPEMLQLFQMAYSDVMVAVQRGMYKNLEVMTSEYLHLPESAPEPTWMWSAFRYSQQEDTNVASTLDRVSHLALRTDRGFINKVRYTYLGHLEEQEFSRFLEFLIAWHRIVGSFQAKEEHPTTQIDQEPADSATFNRFLSQIPDLRQSPPSSFFHLQALMERDRQAVLDILGTKDEGEVIPYQDKDTNLYISEGLRHEIAHALFNILEEEMALTLDIEGFPHRIDLRQPEQTGKTAPQKASPRHLLRAWAMDLARKTGLFK